MRQTDLGLNLTTKRTRKRGFLDEMSRVVPWADLVASVAPFAPEGTKGRPPFAVETMLRIHFLQQWFGPSLTIRATATGQIVQNCGCR